MKVLYYAFACGLLLWCTQLLLPSQLLAVETVSHSPDERLVFFDDFSSGTLDKWHNVRPAPTTHWGVENGEAVGTVQTEYTLAELVPADQYWDASWHDLRYELDYTSLQGVDQNVSWHFQNLDTWYEIHLVQGIWELARYQSGELIWVVNGIDDQAPHQTYHLTLKVDGPLIEIVLNGHTLVHETDPTFNDAYGKVGLKVGSGLVFPVKAQFDNVEVWLLHPDDTSPQPSAAPSPSPSPTARVTPAPSPSSHYVTPLSQRDPAWSALEYDHASQWSSPAAPTIEEWGCALTSLTMIFRHHGITQFLDGTPLTPDTLNAWLKNQPDGYIGHGLLNWVAATRLSQLLSERFGTPTLEFSRVSAQTDSALSQEEQRTQQLATARSDLLLGNPSILHIPNHFLVADGLLYSSTQPVPSDLHIADPAFPFTQFSQHQKPLLSTLRFKPSHTDLSYLLILAPEKVDISLHQLSPDGATTPVTDAVLTSQAAPSLSGAELEPVHLLEYAKPPTATYLLQLESEPFKLQPITIFVYDQLGQLTDLSRTVTPGAAGATITLTLPLSETAQLIQSHPSFQDLAADLQYALEHAGKSKQYALRTILAVMNAAAVATPVKQHIYAQLILHYLEWYQPVLEANIFHYLLDHVPKE